MLELSAVRMDFPPDSNTIVGKSHFIKTAEDILRSDCHSSATGQVRRGL